MMGKVFLVGAGPGDPQLLTLKAARALREADLILMDDLASRGCLSHARWNVRVIEVGKRGGCPSTSQAFIEKLMIQAARAGQTVVRLKGGDPFVLGRGGEEALALTAAGVPFEIVPGVSSAFAAPALSGIPVTHRGLSAGVIVVSGHADASYRPLLEMLPPQAITLVVLMGLRQIEAIADLLLGTGWRARTPVAVIFGAGTPDSVTWTGTLATVRTLDDVSDSERRARRDLPATIVIGDVVSLAAVLDVQHTSAATEAAGSQDGHVSHG